ncbi:MAG: hypothetical protein AAFZ15_31125, partial [Bacteroidota bacterium]
SEFCYDIELKIALSNYELNKCIVFPVIVRESMWENLPIAELQVVPEGGKPISEWDNEDEAFKHITEKLRNLIIVDRASV